MSLRNCQELAIQAVRDRRGNNEIETNLSLCTGAGKSIIIREITKSAERIIIVFPWLDLLNQYFDGHKTQYESSPCLRYLATEGRLPGVQRISTTMNELLEKEFVIFTTYDSAPEIYKNLSSDIKVDLLIHDEAHRAERPQYKAALTKVCEFVKHTVNLSATLPESKEPHYKYPLLRGIKDRVVRDFHMELFLCVAKERNETKLLATIIQKLLALHKQVKLLVYTAEANTIGETSSSVKTFMDKHSTSLGKQGWWIEGINEETTDRKSILRDFEKTREVSILVSCKTLTEGIDLKGANCVLPWDPSASVKDNIQRIGRVLRLYKTKEGTIKKDQPPSTVLIPVFLQEQKYLDCGGDKEKINALLCKEISEGERGNFRPIVSVCTALKEELAEEDEELFNRLLNYPYEPKVVVNRNLVECFAKECKKSVETVLEDVATALEGKVDEEQLELIKEGEWDDDIVGEVAQALADTQKLTLVIRDGDEADIFGTGDTQLTLEKKANDEGYKVVRGKRATADKEEAKKRVAQRLRVEISDGCKVLLGLDSIADADTTGNMVLSRLTTEVQYDDQWEKRRIEWIAMYEKLGRFPNQHSRDPEEQRVERWQGTQRKGYKRKEKWMTSQRIDILNNTAGWQWEKDDTWSQNLQNWITQFNKLGHKPAETSNNTFEAKAGDWQAKQRADYKKKEPRLTKERIQILESTVGWEWQDDSWKISYKKWCEQYKKLGRTPFASSGDEDEQFAGKWQGKQRQNLKNGVKLTPERIALLDSTPGWKWQEEDKWELSRLRWIDQLKKLNHTPSDKSKNADEKKSGQWQADQRKNFRQNAKCMTPERIKILNETPGWSWSANEPPKTPFVPSQPVNEIVQLPSTPAPRLRKPIKVLPMKLLQDIKSSQTRKLSPLQEYHQRFKTMNASTYKSTVKVEEFNHYHQIADAHDAKDPAERQPINKVANLLAKFNKPTYKAIDLGCGKNRLRVHSSVSKMNWTSVDVHSVDDTVTVADMSALPYEDETYDIAVLSRSLWAKNHMTVLNEVFRILKCGGRVVVCESFRRWLNLDSGVAVNTLLDDLKKTGFEIIYEEGTKTDDTVSDVFQYIVARKP